jgi:hypothetical protein
MIFTAMTALKMNLKFGVVVLPTNETIERIARYYQWFCRYIIAASSPPIAAKWSSQTANEKPANIYFFPSTGTRKSP